MLNLNENSIFNSLNDITLSVNNKKNINLGIELLRMILSFFIVTRHFLKLKYKNTFLTEFIFYAQPFYVPLFFLISFYFSYKTFSSRNIDKIKLRFIRILIPYIIWPTLLWIRFNKSHLISFKYNLNMFKSIFYQLLIGYDFYAVLWFQFDLIMISIIISIVIFIFKNQYLLVLKIFGIFCFLINKPYEKTLILFNKNGSIKRLNYATIYSITGFILGSNNILEKIKIIRYKIFFLIFPVIILIYYFQNFLKIAFWYQILYIDTIIIFLFFLFAMLPFNLLRNQIIKRALILITSYTGGIYYIHYGVRSIFSNYIPIIGICDFRSCILNYLLCYLICLIGSKLFKNSILKYLFI